MKKLTPSQREVLCLMRKHAGWCYTAPTTYEGFDCGYAAGQVAASLVKRGLAKYTRGYQVGTRGMTVVSITDLGMEALS